MGNLVSLLAQCGRGDEVILGDRAHTYINEQGGMAALGGIHPRVIRNQPDGTLDLAGWPRRSARTTSTAPHAAGDGREHPQPLRRRGADGRLHARLGELAREHGLLLHVDGARIFNAAVALGVDVEDLVADADSVTFCLSKGLAAPVGSVVCGSKAFIAEARRARKVVGGGMRQAGVIAAAGIVALEQMVDRLAEDHANARALADGAGRVAGHPGRRRAGADEHRLLRRQAARPGAGQWWRGWRSGGCGCSPSGRAASGP